MSGRIPTFADVCCAIAEGHITAAVDGSVYQVNAFELRRYLNKLRPLPSLTFSPSSTSPASLEDPLASVEQSSWSVSVQSSVA